MSLSQEIVVLIIVMALNHDLAHRNKSEILLNRGIAFLLLPGNWEIHHLINFYWQLLSSKISSIATATCLFTILSRSLMSCYHTTL